MVAEQQARRIALFFYLSLMDEKVAVQAAEKAVARLKAGLPAETDGDSSESRVFCIQVCRQQWEKSKKSIKRIQDRPVQELRWVQPGPVDLSVWRRFHKEAGEDEMLAMIFSRILGYAEEEVATALNVSLGTVRHRIGRAIRQIGILSMARA